MKFPRIFAGPWWYLFLLTGALGAGILSGTPFPQDDHFLYQSFVNALAQGTLDLSIAGFHGSDFLATLWHLAFPHEISQIHFQFFCILLIPVSAYAAATSLFRSQWYGVIFATAVCFMPFSFFGAFRGFTGAAFLVLSFLSIAGIMRGSMWTFLPWGLAMLTKPFAVAFLPLLFLCSPLSLKKKWALAAASLALPALYVLLQYLQIGDIHVGAHTDLSPTSVWNGPMRIALNFAHSLQILFSVHNYYFPDPAQTGLGNMLHTSPLLMVFGLFALLYPSTFENQKLRLGLLLSFIIAYGLNLPLNRIDHYYMEIAALLLVLSALPFLQRYRLWIPVVLATLHFQWFYYFLENQEVFALHHTFFVLPAVVDALFLLWCTLHWRRVWAMLRPVFSFS